MASELQINFIKSLVEKTQQKKLSWEIESPSQLRTNIGEMTIFLEKSRGRNGDLISVRIENSNRTIDVITDEDFAETDLMETEYESSFSIMNKFYTNARRQALGADDALLYLLGKLAS